MNPGRATIPRPSILRSTAVAPNRPDCPTSTRRPESISSAPSGIIVSAASAVYTKTLSIRILTPDPRSRRLAGPGRVEHVAEPVAEQVDREHRRGDGDPRQRGDPPGGGDVVPAV